MVALDGSPGGLALGPKSCAISVITTPAMPETSSSNAYLLEWRSRDDCSNPLRSRRFAGIRLSVPTQASSSWATVRRSRAEGKAAVVSRVISAACQPSQKHFAFDLPASPLGGEALNPKREDLCKRTWPELRHHVCNGQLSSQLAAEQLALERPTFAGVRTTSWP